MFPPVPTKDPYTLLSNVWASLSRAASGHWSDQARVHPSDNGEGYVATMQTKMRIDNESWEKASKYITSYARASHWRVKGLKRKKGHVEMQLMYAPPRRPAEHKQRPEPRPFEKKTEE